MESGRNLKFLAIFALLIGIVSAEVEGSVTFKAEKLVSDQTQLEIEETSGEVTDDDDFGIIPNTNEFFQPVFDASGRLTSINQTLIVAQYEAMVSRARTVDGVPTSLLDLGYKSAGIDDCWQECGSGPGGIGFHDASGYPIVNKTRFPDMRAMTAKARSLGLTPGWYGK